MSAWSDLGLLLTLVRGSEPPGTVHLAWILSHAHQCLFFFCLFLVCGVFNGFFWVLFNLFCILHCFVVVPAAHMQVQ